MKRALAFGLGALLSLLGVSAEAQNIGNRNPISPFVLDQRTVPNVICIPSDNSSGLCNGSAAPNVFATWDGKKLDFGLSAQQIALLQAETDRANAAEVAIASTVVTEYNRASTREGQITASLGATQAVAAGAVQAAGGDASGTNVTATGRAAARTLGARAADILNVLDFKNSDGSTIGTGGDDATGIQAAVNAGAGKTSRLLFPPAASGNYNVCSAHITLPTSYGTSMVLQGLAGGGNQYVRVLPGCASPPNEVFYAPAPGTGGTGYPWDSHVRFHFDNMNVDGYCLAAHDLTVDAAVGMSMSNSVMRNAATGGSNVLIKAGFEYDFSVNNRLENLNDAGHTCYTSASALPLYNLDTSGTDSSFNNLIGIGAYRANFANKNGGGNRFIYAHGWGYDPPNEPTHVDLRAQYTFEIWGSAVLAEWQSDSPLVGGVLLHGLNGGLSSAATLVNGGIIGPSPAGVQGIIIDSGLTGALVTNNNCQNGTITAVNCIIQNGTADPTTLVANNRNASYVSGSYPLSPGTIQASGLFLSLGSGLAIDANGKLTYTLPATLPVNSITASGGISTTTPFNVTNAGQYSIPQGGSSSFPLVNITSNTGSGAAAHVFRMLNSNTGTVVTKGTGFAVGDRFALAGGTPINGPLTETVTSVDANGGITGYTYFSNGNYTSLPPDVSSASWTAITGSGTGFATHGLLWQLGGTFFAVDSAGSGYTDAAATISPASGTTVNTPATVTVNLNNNLTISGSKGQVLMDATGTKLGLVGTTGGPVISQGAMIDGSGVRQSLGASYTVPSNTSLVRFIQTGAVTSTITLPTALADGQPIQFVNQGTSGTSGAITATFSPAVPGFANPVTIPANSGLRIRWDSTAGAWQREQ